VNILYGCLSLVR